MNDQLRIYAASLLELAAARVPVGDGIPSPEAADLYRPLIDAVRADPTFDPDGEDFVGLQPGELPTARVYRAVAELLREGESGKEEIKAPAKGWSLGSKSIETSIDGADVDISWNRHKDISVEVANGPISILMVMTAGGLRKLGEEITEAVAAIDREGGK